MLQDFIQNKFLEYLQHSPTQDQTIVLKEFANFINSEKEIFIINGYAGTGKTTLVNCIIKTLKEFEIDSYLMAPTGRAAKVLANYTQKNASTIHKKIYRQHNISEGGTQKFNLNFNKHSKTYFFVDEASMLSNQSNERSVFGTGLLIDDMLNFVFNNKGCKLILLGDDAQLPPVGLVESPALSANYIQTRFLKETVLTRLTEIVRQQSESGILLESTKLRQHLEHNLACFPKLTEHFDIKRIQGDVLIENLENSYNTTGIGETIVITRSNKLANKYNEGIRNMIMWRDSVVSSGDLIMIVKNNYFWTENNPKLDFIANGDIAEIIKIHGYEELYDFHFANVTLSFPDYNNEEIDAKILLETLNSEAPALTFEQNQKLYNTVNEDYSNIKNKAQRYKELRKNKYFNALQIKFAYAVTCHKAQGGQWNHVYIDHGYLPEDTVDTDFLRWLYTAFTRAKECVYMVNFKKNFFE